MKVLGLYTVICLETRSGEFANKNIREAHSGDKDEGDR
jgi:hypothetical protein